MNRLEIKDADFSIVNIDLTEDDFNQLMKLTDWKQDTISMYGKPIPLPRLTAWYGRSYSYSGIENKSVEIPPHLTRFFNLVENYTNISFNSVLLNLYRHGNNSIGWHCDDEKELGVNPVIASLSLGQTRSFLLRHKRTLVEHKIELRHGDLLLMGNNSQVNYLHSIPKEKKYNGMRINLTFRNIL